jgi:hypothetical protein
VTARTGRLQALEEEAGDRLASIAFWWWAMTRRPARVLAVASAAASALTAAACVMTADVRLFALSLAVAAVTATAAIVTAVTARTDKQIEQMLTAALIAATPTQEASEARIAKVLLRCWRVAYGEIRDDEAAAAEALHAAGQAASPGSPFPGRPGYMTGTCGHPVAAREWLGGFRNCDGCGG